MSAVFAAEDEEELLRSLWLRLFQLKRWPTEYQLFFLTASARVTENEGISRAIHLLGRPRALLSLSRSYATTDTDSSRAWALTRAWLSQLSEQMPALAALAEPVYALAAPVSLADCRRLYGAHWDPALRTLADDFLRSPWPLRYPSPMSAVMALHLESALVRVLLSAHPAAQAGHPEQAVDEVLCAIQPLGHRPALLQPMLPRIDGVALSLSLLRM